jgi:DhnA family fructose-bisphosphate aldolase class Ia
MLSQSGVGSGKERRFRRLLQTDGRTLLVALDHAAYLGTGPPLGCAAAVAAGGPDGVLATWDVARRDVADLAGTGLVLRVDGGVSDLGGPASTDEVALLSRAEDALRIGADAVVLLVFPGAHDEHHSLRRLAALCAECENLGLPVIAEAIPGGWAREVEWTPEHVAKSARLVVELGADMVKTVCPGPTDAFSLVAAACPAPVVALGGPPMGNEDDVVATARGIVDAGGAGVAFGRNVWGSPDPAKLVRRLHEAVHGAGAP